MSKNFLEVKNVDFNVAGKTKVRNVSFSIERGDVVLIVGFLIIKRFFKI